MRFIRTRNVRLLWLTFGWLLLSCRFLSVSAASQLVAWGGNDGYGRTNIPPDLTNVVSVALGYSPAYALRSDGTVVQWGDTSETDMQVPPNLTNIVQIVATYYSAMALKSDGTIVSWGYRWAVPEWEVSNVVEITTAGGLWVALKADGTIVRPVEVYFQTPPDLTNEIAVVAPPGASFIVALSGDGHVSAFGNADYGQTSVPDGLSNCVALAACTFDGFGLSADGHVTGWGNGYLGQLDVPSDLTNAVAIATVGDTIYAIRTDTTVAAWGNSSWGDMFTVPRSLTNVTAIGGFGVAGVAIIDDPAPRLLSQPSDAVAWRGGTARFCSFAPVGPGMPPTFYQWKHNGTNVPGGIRPILLLNHVSDADAGGYTLVISNAFGITNSVTASLTVREQSAPRFLPGGIAKAPDGKVDLFFQGEPGLQIAVQASTDFITWTTLTNLTVAAGTNHHTEVGTNASQRFYRLIQSP